MIETITSVADLDTFSQTALVNTREEEFQRLQGQFAEEAKEAEALAARQRVEAVLAGAKKAKVQWRGAAACRGVDPDIFYPTDLNDEASEAKAVCAQCTVRQDCLDYAIANREREGVWGGATERERRRIVRQRRKLN